MADEVRKMVRLLEEAVHRSGRSRRDLERALAVAPGTLDELFAGRAELQVRHLLLLARELGLDPVLFLQGGMADGSGGDPVVEEVERAFREVRAARLAGRPPAPLPAGAGPDLDLAAAKDLVRETIRQELARLARGEPAAGRPEDPAGESDLDAPVGSDD